MVSTTVSIVGLAFLLGSISAAKVPKVVGGSDTVIKQFPYIVSIRDTQGDHFCGGSIITERHILTAAHCVDYGDKDNLRIHSGVSRTDKVGTVRRVVSVHVHPTFEKRLEVDGSDDIAILTLEEPIVFNKYQKKAKLPSHDIEHYQTAYLVGWGRISTTNRDSAKQLQKLRLALLPSNQCQPFLTDTTIDEKQICGFRNVGKSACHGDSGGPLISNETIVGIVSRGDSSNCAIGLPDIYTNVFAHGDFIESIINK